MTRTRPSSRTRKGFPRMASRAATWGRSRGVPGSFIAGESNTRGDDADAEAEPGADAALDFTTDTQNLPLHPLQRGVYPAVERERVPHVESEGDALVRFTASASRRRDV